MPADGLSDGSSEERPVSDATPVADVAAAAELRRVVDEIGDTGMLFDALFDEAKDDTDNGVADYGATELSFVDEAEVVELESPSTPSAPSDAPAASAENGVGQTATVAHPATRAERQPVPTQLEEGVTQEAVKELLVTSSPSNARSNSGWFRAPVATQKMLKGEGGLADLVKATVDIRSDAPVVVQSDVQGAKNWQAEDTRWERSAAAPVDEDGELCARHRAECHDLADACGKPVVILDECVVDLRVLAHVPRLVAQRHRVMPLSVSDGRLTLAIAGTPNPSLVEDVASAIGMPVVAIACAEEHLTPLVRQAYTLFERHRKGVLRGRYAPQGAPVGEIAVAQPQWLSAPLTSPAVTPNPFARVPSTGDTQAVEPQAPPPPALVLPPPAELPIPGDVADEGDVVDRIIKSKPQQRMGRYVIKRLLGEGGMAQASLAVMEGPFGFEKLVVLKRIREERMENPRIVEMFLREARLSAGLNHPHIAQTFDLGVEDGRLFLAMEYIEGLTLRTLCRASWAAGRTVPVDVILRATAEAAEGLAFMHAMCDDEGKNLGFVHRDISPDNIMVGKDGRTRLLDFGLAKAAASEDLTVVGELKGKAPFMAPEQIMVKPLDGRSDLWALGVSLYWMLTGRLPFRGKNHILTLQNIVDDDPPPPSTYNPAIEGPVERLVLDMLRKDKNERIATGFDVQARIQHLLHDPLAERSRDFVREMLQQEELLPSTTAAIRFDDSFVPAGRVDVDGQVHNAASHSFSPKEPSGPVRSEAAESSPVSGVSASAMSSTGAVPPLASPTPPASSGLRLLLLVVVLTNAVLLGIGGGVLLHWMLTT